MLCSLMTAAGPAGRAWRCVRGGSSWVLGKGSSPIGWLGMEQTHQGSDHSPTLLEFKEHLDNTLRHWVCICVELGVGLVGLGIVCDSMTPHSLNAWRVSACFFSLVYCQELVTVVAPLEGSITCRRLGSRMGGGKGAIV